VYPEGQRDLPVERPIWAPEGPPTPEFRKVRTVILEPHPAVRAVLEYLLTQEGHAVEARESYTPPAGPGAGPGTEPGPALFLVAAEDGGGLYVFGSRNAAETLEELSAGAKPSLEGLAGVTGMQAFVPKPFGAGDVLRAVRMVRSYDGRRRNRSETA
jgi:hypothetical protein